MVYARILTRCSVTKALAIEFVSTVLAMKISDFSPVGKAGAAGKKKGTSSSSGADFLGLLSSSGEAENSSPVTSASDISSINSMDTLLALQEMPDEEIQKHKAMQESKGTLEALESLRVALLTGSISGNLVHNLKNVIAIQKQRVNDPRLMSIINDIELRAAVELAKLERASEHS